ncbi:MAG: hypothetical protein ACP5OP_01295 [Leptospirillia bacterium]
MIAEGRRENFPPEEMIGALFEERGLPVPDPVEIGVWRAEAPSEEVFFERVYTGLKEAVCIRALESFGIARESLGPEVREELFSGIGGEVFEQDLNEVRSRILETMGKILVASIEEEALPMLRFSRLLTFPIIHFAMAWSDLPRPPLPWKEGGIPLERQLLRGAERAFAHQGKPFSRSRLAEDIQEGRRQFRAEIRRIRSQKAMEKRREKSFRLWIRSLWNERRVRRELGIKPAEFSVWVEEGRIPVLLRIESLREGRVREQKLFDPETVRRISPAMIARWRRFQEKPPGRSKKKKE